MSRMSCAAMRPGRKARRCEWGSCSAAAEVMGRARIEPNAFTSVFLRPTGRVDPGARVAPVVSAGVVCFGMQSNGVSLKLRGGLPPDAMWSKSRVRTRAASRPAEAQAATGLPSGPGAAMRARASVSCTFSGVTVQGATVMRWLKWRVSASYKRSSAALSAEARLQWRRRRVRMTVGSRSSGLGALACRREPWSASWSERRCAVTSSGAQCPV